MANVWITEYKGPVVFQGAGVPVGLEPSLAVQNFAFGGSTPSAALNAETTFVRIKADGNMHYKVGASISDTPTATTSDTPVDAGVAEYFGVPAGFKIAFIDGA